MNYLSVCTLSKLVHVDMTGAWSLKLHTKILSEINSKRSWFKNIHVHEDMPRLIKVIYNIQGTFHWEFFHYNFCQKHIMKYNLNVHAIMHFWVFVKNALLTRHINLVSETSELVLLRCVYYIIKSIMNTKSENLCHENIRVSNEISTCRA